MKTEREKFRGTCASFIFLELEVIAKSLSLLFVIAFKREIVAIVVRAVTI